MRRPISDDESTDSEPVGSAAATIATAATHGSCSQFLTSSSRRRPRQRRPRVGSPLPLQRRRRAGSRRLSEAAHSSQEYLSAVSTTGDTTTPDESPSSRAATIASTMRTTTTTTTSMIYRDTSPGTSMAVQGPSSDLQDAPFALSDDLSDAPVTLRRHVPEFTPRQRDKRASVPADTPASPQMALFRGKRRSEREKTAHVPAKRVDRTREGDLPLLIKIQKSISEGNLLFGSPQQRQHKRRWKPRESVPFALSRNVADTVAPDWTPLMGQSDEADKETDPSLDSTSPASFIVQYSEVDEMKSARTMDDVMATTPGMITLSQPATQTGTSSLPLGTTDDTTPSGDITGSIKASRPPVPAERCSKLTGSLMPLPRHQGRRATSEWSGEGDGSISGRESADPTSPNKGLLAHWEKVFGRKGLEISANKSEEAEDGIQQEFPEPREASSATTRTDAARSGASTSRSAVVAVPELRVLAVEKSEHSLMIELHSLSLKSGTGQVLKHLPQAQKRDKKGPRRESLGVKRTAAVGNLVEGQVVERPRQDASPREQYEHPVPVQPLQRDMQVRRRSTYSELQSPEPSSATTRDAAPDSTSIKTRDGLAKAREAAGKQKAHTSRSSRDRTGKRVLPMSSHPAPRTPTFRYYMSHSSLSSGKRTPRTSSPNVSTHGQEYYKGYLHAGKVLPPPGGVSDSKSLPSSFPILEESDAHKQLAQDVNNVPAVEHPAAPVPKDRKTKEVVEKATEPVKKPSLKDVEIVSPPQPLQPKEPEQRLPKPVSEAAIDEKREAVPKPLQPKEHEQRLPKPASGTAIDEKREAIPKPLQPKEPEQRLPKPVSETVIDEKKKAIPKPLQPKEHEQRLPKPASETAIDKKREVIPEPLQPKESEQRLPKPASETAIDEKKEAIPKPLQPKDPKQRLPKPVSETTIDEKREAIPKSLQPKEPEKRLPKPVPETTVDEKREASAAAELRTGTIALPAPPPLPSIMDQRPVQDIPHDGGAFKLAKPRQEGDALEEKRPTAVAPSEPYPLKEVSSKGDLDKLEVDSLGPDDKDTEAKKSNQNSDESNLSVLSVEFPPRGSIGGSVERAPEEVVEPGEPKEGTDETGAPAGASESSIDKKAVVEKEDASPQEAASTVGPPVDKDSAVSTFKDAAQKSTEHSEKSKSGSGAGELPILEVEMPESGSSPEHEQGAPGDRPEEGAVVAKREGAESNIVAKTSDLEAGAKEDLEAGEAPITLEGDEVTKHTSSAAERSKAKTGSSLSAKEDKPPSSEQQLSKSEAAPESEGHPLGEEAGEKTHDEEPEEKSEEPYETKEKEEGDEETEKKHTEGGETLAKEESEKSQVEEEGMAMEESHPRKAPPPKTQTGPDVQVKLAFVKPKGDEAYYIAMVRIRTIPLLLLFGNILVLIIFLVMSYLDLFVYFYVGPVVPPVIVPNTTKKGLGHVCRTIRCGIGGTTLFYAINHNVEPCDSMFQYVCERWIHEPSEKYRKVVLGAEKHVTDDMYAEMRRLVESYHPYAQSGYALGKLAMLYKGCEDFRKRDQNGVGPLNKLRQKYALSDWPYDGRFSGKPEELMAEYIRDTGSGVFVSVRMIPDPDDAQFHARKLIALECSTFVLPTDMLLTYRTTQKEVIKAYKIYISSIVEDFQHGPSEKMVSNIFAFEVNLAHRCDVQCRRKRLKKIKVSEIGQYTDKDSGINWVKVLKTIMTGVTYEITADTMILVRSVSYFKKLGLLFRDGTTKTRAMNYFGWRFMQKFARHTTFKYRNSYKAFQETVLGQPPMEDWMRCLVDTAEAMPLAMGRVYAELMGYEAADYRAVGMMATLQEGLRQMLTEFKWVQSEAKERVFAILSKSSMTVGYPAWLMNDTRLNAYYETVPSGGSYVEAVAKAMGANYMNQLKISATTTEVFGKMSNFIFPSRLVELHQKSGPPRESLLYDIRSNHFAIPSGVMNPPYYVSEATWSMNFGGLGVLVAKDLVNEFFHAVDAGWMSEDERIEFNKSGDCLLTAIGKSSRTGSADEAVMKCGGLVSDLLALRLSYTAYHTYADARDETTLPGLEDKSPDQVFFVAAFRTLCTQLRERYYVPVVRGKQKVPELAYLDALMRSMNEFTDAFNCPDGKYRQNIVRECLTGEKSGAASGRLKSRKRALWNPPNASMTSVQTPTDTTPSRTVYKRRYNRTVFKRPLDRTGDAALVREKF